MKVLATPPRVGLAGLARVLVLGRTAWLGREVARRALADGHEVTCLARGSSGSPPAGATRVRADRAGPDAYAGLRGDWDLVVDVARHPMPGTRHPAPGTRHPGQVRGAVQALAECAGLWVLVSSGNVYADHSVTGADESAGVLPPLGGDMMTDMSVYGEAKVACERLVPDEPHLGVAVIDVRDLAGWLLDAAGRGVGGTFDVVGPRFGLTAHLEVARRVAGHTGPLRPASSAWLLEHGVEAWMGPRSLPLWLPDPGWRGFCSRDGSRARAAGLGTRPLEETLTDTLTWERGRPPDHVRRAGLTADEERSLLAELGAPTP